MALTPLPEFDIPSPEELAKVLPQLDVQRFVARGGMGAVYYAVQRHLERQVALKILPYDIGEPDFRSRFSLEAKAMARLNHSNLTQLYDFGETGGLLWMALEWIDGPTLHSRFQSGPLTEEEAVALVRQVCDGLAYAHRHGIVHRDVKPENIMWNSEGV
ncbi:MAG: serine/threonine protein kinase, partial [Roseibacillus sp.]|nr:serine/threonine protein kinase [Roseibacillus sp.]